MPFEQVDSLLQEVTIVANQGNHNLLTANWIRVLDEFATETKHFFAVA